MGLYSDIFRSNQYQLAQTSVKSKTWFLQQAKLLSKQDIKPLALIQSETRRNTNHIIPGELYTFMYDAKHRDTLPYWDMFPLVFPYRRLKDGFIGLNFHYLNYQMRIQLLDRLMEFKTNKTLNETTRIKYSWATIQGSSKLKIAEPCIHRYLLSHVQSPFKKIEAPDWTTALMLPVERFVGASKQRVWTESLRK